jgi:HNH endonuclease
MSKQEIRKYFGKAFWKQKNGYWANYMPIHAQRWVWINHYGAISQGMDIHHKDGNKDNNEIENLEMMTRSDHLKRHWQEGRFDLDQRRKQLAEARKWLSTPTGRKKQREDALESWQKREAIKLICCNCGNEFKAFFKRAKFCSNPCNYQYRRKNSENPVQNPRKQTEKTCTKCGNLFMAAMPYALYCSTRCRKGKK